MVDASIDLIRIDDNPIIYSRSAVEVFESRLQDLSNQGYGVVSSLLPHLNPFSVKTV
jgi:hypothetical protein